MVQMEMPILALGPNDPDDGDEGRRQRGVGIAALVPIQKVALGYKVPSQSGKGTYIVNIDGEPFCSCPDFERRHEACKHVYAVECLIHREERPDGTATETHAMRVTYAQNWAAYNQAQMYEQDHFASLLRELCEMVPEPEYQRGRPRLPIADVLFGMGLKVYSTFSNRRAMSALRNARDKGLLENVPSTASTYRAMEDPALERVLRDLIIASAQPLQSVEIDFALDSSGFSTNSYAQWHAEKWGKGNGKKKHDWVKAHIICGVKTNIIASAEVTTTNSADTIFLPGLLADTKANFHINEVSADKAYSSKMNINAIEEIGAKGFIPFKSYSTGSQGHRKVDRLWSRAFHYYKLHQEEFLAHYHKRSNVETAFMMVKAKFGTFVRSRSQAAQVNEVLVKFLCHNICVLVQSIYELGIDPSFELAKHNEGPMQPMMSLN